MIIILEGPDGAGKSSLASALICSRMNGGPFSNTKIEHTEQPDPEGPGAYHEYLWELAMLKKSVYSSDPDWLVVYDRFHLGELVYGPIMRDGSHIDEREARLIDGMLKSMGAVLVTLDAPDHILLDRAFDERGEDFVNREQLIEVAQCYRDLTDHLSTGWLRIDTGPDGYSTKQARDLVWRIAHENATRRYISA